MVFPSYEKNAVIANTPNITVYWSELTEKYGSDIYRVVINSEKAKRIFQLLLNKRMEQAQKRKGYENRPVYYPTLEIGDSICVGHHSHGEIVMGGLMVAYIIMFIDTFSANVFVENG